MKYKTKQCIVWGFHPFTFPLALISNTTYRSFDSESVFDFCAKLLSLVPGKVGQYIRTSFYMQTLRGCSYDLSVGFCSFFAHPGAEVGRRLTVGSFSIIGTANIADNVLISSRVSVLSGKYQHGGGFQKQETSSNGIRYEKVKIGRGAWLGEGSLVMADVGENCIVSAGSVVTKPMPEGTTAIGNPARFLKMTEV